MKQFWIHAFTIAAAAPTVAPAKARVARSSIKARAAPVRRTIRTKATAEASADALLGGGDDIAGEKPLSEGGEA